MRPKLKRSIQIAALSAAIYLIAYVVLSHYGAYMLTQSGEVRWGFGLSASDIEQWQPRFVLCQRFHNIDGGTSLRANPLGYIFAPLVLLDQSFVHKTAHLIDPVTGKATGITHTP